MRTQKNLIVCALLVLVTAGLEAQGTATLVRQRQGMRLEEPWRPPSAKSDTRIIGQVVDIRQVPVPYARVQLRNLINGTIQQESASDRNGEYQFTIDDPGTYVVEVVLVDGYIVALSNAVLSRYETLQTVVQRPADGSQSHGDAAEGGELLRHERRDDHDRANRADRTSTKHSSGRFGRAGVSVQAVARSDVEPHAEPTATVQTGARAAGCCRR